MLIRCPTCSSSYDLPTSLFQKAAGRTLRCAQCRECWTVKGEGGPSNVFALFGPDHGPEIVAETRSGRHGFSVAPPPRPHQRARIAGSLRRSWRNAATIAIGFVLLVAAMTGVARKDDVVRALPQSAVLYEAIGLKVNLRGLALDAVRGTLEAAAEGAPPMLTLEGKISNLRRETTAVPRLRFTLRDRTRVALYSWTASAPKPRLDAGESVVFRSRLATPPEDGRDLVVSFADPVEAPGASTEHR